MIQTTSGTAQLSDHAKKLLDSYQYQTGESLENPMNDITWTKDHSAIDALRVAGTERIRNFSKEDKERMERLKEKGRDHPEPVSPDGIYTSDLGWMIIQIALKKLYMTAPRNPIEEEQFCDRIAELIEAFKSKPGPPTYFNGRILWNPKRVEYDKEKGTIRLDGCSLYHFRLNQKRDEIYTDLEIPMEKEKAYDWILKEGYIQVVGEIKGYEYHLIENRAEPVLEPKKFYFTPSLKRRRETRSPTRRDLV